MEIENLNTENSKKSDDSITFIKVNGKASVITKGGDGGIPEYFDITNGQAPDLSQKGFYG